MQEDFFQKNNIKILIFIIFFFFIIIFFLFLFKKDIFFSIISSKETTTSYGQEIYNKPNINEEKKEELEEVISNNNFEINETFEKENFNLEKLIETEEKEEILEEKTEKIEILEKQERVITRVNTPQEVKALYYTSYVINSKNRQKTLSEMIDAGYINSVIFDIKEVDGKISFKMDDENFSDIKPVSANHITDIKTTIDELHKKNIYVIGRIVIFKDNYLAKIRPDLAVKNPDKETVWEDYGKKNYLDANSKEVWNYNMEIASKSYELGFDEINFDYIRFPSDGDLKNVFYPFSNEILTENPKWGKSIIIDSFSKYLSENLKKKYPEIILSADVFGMTTENYDDLGIGQTLESFLLHFDYVAPMIYPSHYPKWYRSIKNPDGAPFIVFDYALSSATKKIEKLNEQIILAKENGGEIILRKNFKIKIELDNLKEIKKEKIRSWIQGFSCSWCSVYTQYDWLEIQSQIAAIEKNGFKSWMIWNSNGIYYKNWFSEDGQ